MSKCKLIEWLIKLKLIEWLINLHQPELHSSTDAKNF